MSTPTPTSTPGRRRRKPPKPPTVSTHQSNTAKRLSTVANRRGLAKGSPVQTSRAAQKGNERNIVEDTEETIAVSPPPETADGNVIAAEEQGVEAVLISSSASGELIPAPAYLHQNLRPVSDKFDPFAALPANLNRFQEHLISFYLFHYPHATYGFSPRLKPHPVATNFTIAMTTPACFQTILSRAALYRGSLKTYGSDKEKKALELAMLRHKVEAIRLVHGTSVQWNRSKEPRLKDDLLASIMALGNLDRRSGSVDSADMHYTAIRRILKSTGGPLAISNPMLARVSVFFECIYGTSPQSYIWEKADFTRLLTATNDFLRQIRNVWSEPPVPGKGKGKAEPNDLQVPPRSTFALDPDSPLCTCISKTPRDPSDLTRQDRLELIWQVTCLLTLAAIVVDYHDDAEGLEAYMARLYKVVEEVQLAANEASNNIMWLIQISDLTEVHGRRILRAAESAWISKHLKSDMQTSLKDWLLQFLTGQVMTRPFTLNIFNFSYAS